MLEVESPAGRICKWINALEASWIQMLEAIFHRDQRLAALLQGQSELSCGLGESCI